VLAAGGGGASAEMVEALRAQAGADGGEGDGLMSRGPSLLSGPVAPTSLISGAPGLGVDVRTLSSASAINPRSMGGGGSSGIGGGSSGFSGGGSSGALLFDPRGLSSSSAILNTRAQPGAQPGGPQAPSPGRRRAEPFRPATADSGMAPPPALATAAHGAKQVRMVIPRPIALESSPRDAPLDGVPGGAEAESDGLQGEAEVQAVRPPALCATGAPLALVAAAL
jgi:hypothetical protein